MGILDLSSTPEQEKIVADDYELLRRTKSGANWFYWIAGLSLVNSIIYLFGGNLSFIAGLGITQLLDAVVDQLTRSEGFSAVKIITFVVDLIIAGIFVLCGLWANKLEIWAFVVGMVLYVLDTVLLLAIGAYLPVAFHAFALFMIFRGLSAARQIKTSQNLPIS